MSRVVRLSVLLVASWVVMTASHECGHLIGGWLSGATLKAVDLLPWHLPYSLHQPDPIPLVTLWSGPVLGILLPVGIAALVRYDWMWFIADFCILANGTYLALGWLSGDRFLDTTRLIDAGSSTAIIAMFCLFTIVVGYLRFRRDCVAILKTG